MPSLNLNDEQMEYMRNLARQDLYFLAKGVLQHDLLVPSVHRPICDHLSNLEVKLIGLVVPRSFFKTTIATISYVLWRVINNPDIRILICCNTFPNACKILSAIKQQVDGNATFRALFPEILPDTSRRRWSSEALEFERTRAWPEATIEAAGMATQVTSRHYDEIIEDDLVAPTKDELKQGMAVPDRDKCSQAIGWHQSTHGLAVKPANQRILSVGTRWASYDIINWQQENEDFKWLFLRAEENGIPTFPERYPREVLDNIATKIGSYLYSTQYLNEPRDVENQIFSPLWIKYTNPKEFNKVKDRRTCIILDPASSEANSADFNGIVVVTLGGNNCYYLRECHRVKANPLHIINLIIRLYIKYSEDGDLPPQVWVEKAGYQRTFKFWFEKTAREQGLYITARLYQAGRIKGFKVQHINSLQPFFETGRFFIPPGCDELESELKDHPLGEHDDLIDALAWGPKVLGSASSTTTERFIERDDPYGIDAMIEEAKKTTSTRTVFPHLSLLVSSN